jgi:hypothetical protein
MTVPPFLLSFRARMREIFPPATQFKTLELKHYANWVRLSFDIGANLSPEKPS